MSQLGFLTVVVGYGTRDAALAGVAVPDVPKTRSGKIMRRLLADLVEGRTLGDATSLQDAAVLGRIRAVLDASPR
ncbi:hypothetical protein DZF99_16195 [Clavibacter phaseoli]|nr:hypothetical protein DZF99_16195 [Clavibacter phaseoli]